MDFTTTKLIADMRRRGSIPDSLNTPSDNDLIDFMNDALELVMIPEIMKTKEEYFVASETFILAAGENRFRIPERAIGNRIRAVELVDSNDKVLRKLSRVQPELGGPVSPSAQFFDTPRTGYYFESDFIVIAHSDPVSIAPRLRIKYYRTPNSLVLAENAGQVVSILGNVLTIDKNIETFEIGTVVDVINGKSPFDLKSIDSTLVNSSGITVEVDAETAANVAVGDWVSHAQTSPIPMFPRVLHPMFIQYALMKFFDSVGDEKGSADAQKDLAYLVNNLYSLLDDRDDGSPQKIVTDDGIFDYTDNWFWRS